MLTSKKSQALVAPLIFLCKLWKRYLSPLVGEQCRFYPSCSDYAAQALSKYGLLKGVTLTAKRVMHCNPWGRSCGCDPVP